MSIPGSGSPLLLASSAAVEVDFAEIANSLRFNSGDSAYLNRTPSSAGNRKTWTWSAWVKRSSLGTSNVYQRLFEANVDNSNFTTITFTDTDELEIMSRTSGTNRIQVRADAKLRDPSAWYHFVVAVDTTATANTDKCKLYVNGVLQDATYSVTTPDNHETNINRTIAHRIGSKDGSSTFFDGYLADVYFIDGTAHNASTFGAYDDNNVWQAIVPSGLTYGTNGFHLEFNSTATTAALGTDTSGNSNTFTVNNFSIGDVVNVIPSGTGLDSYIPSGWTRTNDADDVLVNNTTGVFVNQGGTLYFGITPTSSSITIKWIVYDGSGTYNPTVSLNTSSSWNGTTVHPSVSGSGSASSPAVGTYSVTSGTTYYVRTGLTGNGNPALVVYATNVNIVTLSTDTMSADVSKDSPTTDTTNTDTGAGGELSGNYAVWNALPPGGSSTYATLSNGNLDASLPASGKALAQTIFPQSGKWYCEIDFVSGGGAGGGLRIGVINEKNIAIDLGSTANSWAYLADGRVYHNASAPSYGVSSAPGDILMMALDIDAGKLWYGKNGTWMASGNPAAGSNPSQTFTAGQKMSFSAQSGSGTVQVINANFGSKAWSYNAPTGFKAVCTTNLPTPTIADGSNYFDTLLWTGDNAVSRTLTGLEFSPDLVWHQARSIAWGSGLVDVVRGVGSGGPTLRTFNNSAEETVNNFGAVTALTSDGFTVSKGGFSSNQWAYVNQSGATYVAWAWDAGTSTVSNTDGSITATVRANQTAGFSIVKFTGPSSAGFQSVGHGLNAKPEFIICKDLDNARNWSVYHKDSQVSDIRVLPLNQNVATFNSGTATWDISEFSNTTFTPYFRDDYGASFSADNIAYCFAPVAGFSHFGSYTATGSSDGPYVETGFVVAWLLTRRTNSAASWEIHDLRRPGYNPQDDRLIVNESVAEASGNNVDLLSNGFKIRNTFTGMNGSSGDTYVYAAFAANPFAANGGLAR